VVYFEYFCGVFNEKIFEIMKSKMFDALKKRYSNLGLSDEQLNLVVPMAILGLSDDADAASIDARASESYISDMLKNMQSQSDKIRSLEKKPKEEPKPTQEEAKSEEPAKEEPKVEEPKAADSRAG
jgi:hypothetical protein